MSTQTRAAAHTNTAYNNEDVRVGKTLQALMQREEITPEGWVVLRKISHGELATGIVLPGKPNGINRSYISQIVIGAKHLNDDLLYAIARYLRLDPMVIKVPDAVKQAERFDLGLAA
jgi:hypothetical protein